MGRMGQPLQRRPDLSCAVSWAMQQARRQGMLCNACDCAVPRCCQAAMVLAQEWRIVEAFGGWFQCREGVPAYGALLWQSESGSETCCWRVDAAGEAGRWYCCSLWV
jgi:hypothetical protein